MKTSTSLRYATPVGNESTYRIRFEYNATKYRTNCGQSLSARVHSAHTVGVVDVGC